MNTNNILLSELCEKQRKKIEKKFLLEVNDLVRIIKYTNKNIFNKTECVLWKGYLTKCNNNKACYANFYLKKKKIALHRILYINFIDDLNDKQYLKFTCNNPGKCCNINHISKVCENDNVLLKDISNNIKDISSNIKITKITNTINGSNINTSKIIIIFDD